MSMLELFQMFHLWDQQYINISLIITYHCQESYDTLHIVASHQLRCYN